MRIHVAHDLPAALDRVESALLDPSLLARIPTFVGMIGDARELIRHDHGDRVEREVRYTAAFLPAPLAAVIPRAWATWIERSDWARREHAGSFTIEPQIPGPLRRRVRCHGTYALHRLAPESTRRQITIDLQILAAGVGPRAEAALARVLDAQFAGEALLLTERAGAR